MPGLVSAHELGLCRYIRFRSKNLSEPDSLERPSDWSPRTLSEPFEDASFRHGPSVRGRVYRSVILQLDARRTSRSDLDAENLIYGQVFLNL